MKSQEALQAALEQKEKQLAEAKQQLDSAQTWITANDLFGVVDKDGFAHKTSAEFRETCLAEKIDRKERVIRLEEQVKFLKWALQ